MKNLQEFIDKLGITMSAKPVGSNPNMGDWTEGSRHWKCVFELANRQMTVYFSQGPAISKEPTAADVLDCLASDATSWENSDGFEGWAKEFGYEPDSRKAEKVYKTVWRQTDKLVRFLANGRDYETLLWDTERL